MTPQREAREELHVLPGPRCVLADQGERGLVGVVEMLTLDLAVQSGDGFNLLAAALAAALAPRQGLLRLFELRGGFGAVVGVRHELAA